MYSNIPEIFTIEWDVCIIPNGPHIIEGNDGWDVVLHHAFDRCKMRKLWKWWKYIEIIIINKE